MKTSISIIKLTSVAVAITCLMGCKKTLKEYNPSATTAENYFTSPDRLQSLVAAAYSKTKFWYGKEDGMGISEMGTDIWTLGSEGHFANNPLRLHNYPLTIYQNFNPANENLTRAWRQFYAAINLCNYGIKNAGEIGAPPATIAELKFLRAFYYWHIVETWGGVHFTTEPTSTAITTANRTPEIVFYNQIIDDLEGAEIAAIKNLPDAPGTYGRINKQSATAFLARVYLTKGQRFKDNDALTKARSYAESVINSGKYKLQPEYKDLWDMSKQGTSTEVIFSVNYADPNIVSDVYDENKNPFGYGEDILSNNGNPTNNRGGNNLHAVFVPRYEQPNALYGGASILARDVRNGISYARFKPTLALFNLFDETKDSRYYGSFQTVWLVNRNNFSTGHRLRNRVLYRDTALIIDKNPPVDNSKYFSIRISDLYGSNGQSIGTNSPTNQIYPTLSKFLDELRGTSPNEAGAGNVQSRKDVYVIRLAEMYLIAAEASIALGEPAAATPFVNTLRRERAIVGKESEMEVGNADMTIDFILDERAREFAGEQIRWFDLKRTGKLIERINKYNPDAAAVQPFHYLRPIPQLQIDAVTNKGEFVQNPGY